MLQARSSTGPTYRVIDALELAEGVRRRGGEGRSPTTIQVPARARSTARLCEALVAK